jgi:RNA polymerase sigma-70 factor (ECF subfamily)
MIDELYTEYESMLQRYALRLLHGDAVTADDLVQDTFVRAMGHIELLKLLNPHQRRAWLTRTLKNLFLDGIKAQKRRQALLNHLGTMVAANIRRVDELAGLNPFDWLAPDERELFEKRYILGLNSKEIASELSIPAATVRSRLHLAVKRVRADLALTGISELLESD